MVQFGQGLRQTPRAAGLQDDLLVLLQAEAYSGISYSVTPQQLHNMIALRARPAHKFQARRDVIEQFAHRNRRALESGPLAALGDLAPTHNDVCSWLFALA